jgi:elongation factor P
MISTSEFEKGLIIKSEGQFHEIVEFQFVNPGKGAAFYRTKLRNIITSNVVERTFKSGEQFEETETEKIKSKFLYSHRDRFFFAKESDPSARFDVSQESLGRGAGFLKANQPVEAIALEGKIISITLPIKISLKIKEAPPNYKGNTAQGGNKTAVLETGTQINVPLFVKEGDLIEINTVSGEYVKRVE